MQMLHNRLTWSTYSLWVLIKSFKDFIFKSSSPDISGNSFFHPKVIQHRSGCVRFTKRFILGLDYYIFFHSWGPSRDLSNWWRIRNITHNTYCSRISKSSNVDLSKSSYLDLIVLLCRIKYKWQWGLLNKKPILLYSLNINTIVKK